MTEEVEPMMMAYVGLSVLLALVELITVVLAAAYVAQISRKMRRENRSFELRARNEGETRPVLRSVETNF